jgi:hypothetical protein
LDPETGARVAEGAGNPDVVARLGRVAAQRRLRRHAAEHGDAQVQRAARRVAADQFAAIPRGEREESLAERGEPRFIRFRQRERQRERLRLRAHRGEIRQIHRERFVTQRFGIDIGEEMAAFHQHVGRYRQHFAGARREQRAVVADAERLAEGVGRSSGGGSAGKEAVDQRELGEHGGQW